MYYWTFCTLFLLLHLSIVHGLMWQVNFSCMGWNKVPIYLIYSNHWRQCDNPHRDFILDFILDLIRAKSDYSSTLFFTEFDLHRDPQPPLLPVLHRPQRVTWRRVWRWRGPCGWTRTGGRWSDTWGSSVTCVRTGRRHEGEPMKSSQAPPHPSPSSASTAPSFI